jgi:SAM-dependent methyltransferase
MLSNFKKYLNNSWLFPRYIGIVYVEPVMREVKSLAGGTMLDVGCGTRRYESIFSDVVDDYIGLDWPEIEDRARPDVVGDATKLPLKAACVDVVLATELMEHLPSPHRFLEEVARVLRDDGTLILSVPFMEPIHEEPRDYYRFTPFSLRHLLDQHGFSLQKIWNKGGWWSVVLGSFVNQSLYNWSTSLDQTGHRHYSFITFIVLPICALSQWLGYQLDRIFHSHRYTLGYTLVATRATSRSPHHINETNV